MPKLSLKFGKKTQQTFNHLKAYYDLQEDIDVLQKALSLLYLVQTVQECGGKLIAKKDHIEREIIL